MSFIVTASHGACEHASDPSVSAEPRSSCSEHRGHAESALRVILILS